MRKEELKDEIDRMVGKKVQYNMRMIDHDMKALDALAVVHNTDRQKLIDLAIKRFIADLQG